MIDRYDVYYNGQKVATDLDLFTANSFVKNNPYDEVVMKCGEISVSVSPKLGEIKLNNELVPLDVQLANSMLVNFNRIYETYSVDSGHTSEIIYIIGLRAGNGAERLIVVKSKCVELWGENEEFLKVLKVR